MYWDINESIPRPLGGQEVTRNGFIFTPKYIVSSRATMVYLLLLLLSMWWLLFVIVIVSVMVVIVVVGRPIENQRPMFFSPLVG